MLRSLTPPARPVLFQAAALVPSPDTPLQPDGGVLVEGGLITGVGASNFLDVPANAEVIDLGEVTLVPGLVDAHVHLGFDGSTDPTAAVREADEEALGRVLDEAALRQVISGVTTVRDLGCRRGAVLRLRHRISRGAVVGPRVVAADAPLTVPGGHCWYMSDECADVERMLTAVEDRARDGADVVKVMLTGGFLHSQGEAPHRPAFSTSTLRRVVQRSHALGLRVASHAHGTAGIAVAVEAGVDTIEHATMTTPAGVVFDPALAESIAEADIVVVPTLNGRWIDDDLPWASSDVALGVVRQLHEAGVRIALGTDAGIDGVAHGNYAHAVAAATAAGLAAPDVFRAATETAAVACGSDHEVGRLAVGYVADFVAVRGDPRVDASWLGDVRAVVCRGRLLARSVLS